MVTDQNKHKFDCSLSVSYNGDTKKHRQQNNASIIPLAGFDITVVTRRYKLQFSLLLHVNVAFRADYFRTKRYLFSVSISAFGLLFYNMPDRT